MKLVNLFELDDSDYGRYDPEQDSFSKQSRNDVRKPSLTLRRINRLKKIRATKRLEQLKREDLLTVMYGQGGGEEEGGMGSEFGF